MKNRVVFFDIDGTMLSTGGAGQQAMERALTEEFRIQHPFEGVFTAGRTDFGIANEIFSRYAIAELERQRFVDAYLERLPDCLAESGGRLLPGVDELLLRLSASGLAELGLLTGNYAEGAWMKLRHFGIDHYFGCGGFGDDHSHRDDVARAALSAADVHFQREYRGADIVVIGDTPADIQCARAIQAKAVAVATGVYDRQLLDRHAPDHLFDDFSGTDDVLRCLLP